MNNLSNSQPLGRTISRWLAVIVILTLALASPAAIRQAAAKWEPVSGANLNASFKAADHTTVAPGEKVTFTIHLYNSGTAAATATVVDPLPAELDFVSSLDGVFADGKVTWANVTVASGKSVSLAFTAEIAADYAVTAPTRIVNTAEIQSPDLAGPIFRREVILLIPEPVADDDVRPTLQSVVIGDQDVYGQRDVTVKITSTDTDIAWMYVREFILVEYYPQDQSLAPLLKFEVAQSSGWVPFHAEVPWKLANHDGVHFIVVRVADEALNLSHLDEHALDYANLIVPDAALTKPGWAPYVVNFTSVGEPVKITMTPSGGNADLYVWQPEDYENPIASVTPEDAVETIEFTVAKAGPHIILVANLTADSYNISIAPLGGPDPLGLKMNAANAGSIVSFKEPIFQSIGINPLGYPELTDIKFVRLSLPIIRQPNH